MRILIVDDSNASKQLLLKYLKSIICNDDITIARNGKEALLLLVSDIKYNLLFLDLGLPDISGLQVLDILKDLKVDCPIITILEEKNQGVLKKSIELGATDYVIKPLVRSHILEVVRRNLIVNHKKRKRVLLVDDDITSRKIIKTKLLKNKYEVTEATNGFEAIRMTKIKYYDCILMDIYMPFMNGIEASINIRRDYPDTPIIIITAKYTEEIKKKCLEIGIDMILDKPLDLNILMNCIKRMIHGNEAKLKINFPNENHNKELFEQEQQFSMFENFLKFVPRTYIENQKINKPLNRGLAKIHDCTVVFVDIRDFTEMAERIGPKECFKFLNSYFELIEPIVQSFGGMVYQFLGDGIVCTFPLYKSKYTNNAVHAAISIQDRIFIYNRGRLRAGYDPIKVGCGVSTGPVATGICGSNERFEVGIFGSTMNIAARSQSACRDFGIEIAITSDTYDRLEKPDEFLIRPIGKHKLKGVKKHVPLFEVFCHNVPKQRMTKLKSLEFIKDLSQKKSTPPYETLIQYCPNDPVWSKIKSLGMHCELH